MNHDKIKHISNNLYGKLNAFFKKFDKYTSEEDIHQFRLAYKKLRAFFRMIYLDHAKAGEIKLSKKIKKIYRITGDIRDIQLHKQQVLDATKQVQKKPKVYLRLLQEEIDKLKKDMSKIFSKNLVIQSKKKTNTVIPDTFSFDSLKNFITWKKAGIDEILSSGYFSDINIHTIRKILKDVFYNMRIFEKVDHEIISLHPWLRNNRKGINSLLEKLGTYQDKRVNIDKLKSFKLSNITNYKLERLEQVQEKWTKEKRSMKQELVKRLKSEMNLLLIPGK